METSKYIEELFIKFLSRLFRSSLRKDTFSAPLNVQNDNVVEVSGYGSW